MMLTTASQLNAQFIQYIHAHYNEHVSEDGVLLTPNLERISTPKRVEIGDEFVVKVAIAGAGTSTIASGNNDNVVLLEAMPDIQEYRFEAEGVGVETVRFAFAHETSGAVVTDTVEIEVVDN